MLEFDGTDDYVSLPDNGTELRDIANPSVAAWFRTSSSETQRIFRVRLSSYGLIMSDAPLDGNLTFFFWNASTVRSEVNSTLSYNDESWHHVVGVYDGSDLRLYVDGVEVASESCNETIYYPSDAKIAIGRDPEPATEGFWNGSIDEVQVYNRAINITEVQYLYNNPEETPLNSTGLVGWWRFDEGSGNTLHDETANNDGTILGAAWTPRHDSIFPRDEASFTVGADLDVRGLRVNASHVWLNTSVYYDFCFWIPTPIQAAFTIDDWFENSRTTDAQFTITSPVDRSINFSLHVPEADNATATNVVSYTWVDSTKTLQLTANTATSSSFVVNVNMANHPPENSEVTITNMDVGNWIFTEYKYYSFQAVYSEYDSYTDLDVCGLRFSDGVHTIEAYYDQSIAEWGLVNGSDVATLKTGTVSGSGADLTVTYSIWLKSGLLDVLGVDLYLYCNDTLGEEDTWELMAEDYCNIYNLGGHTSLEYGGAAGRETGADYYELYVEGDGSTATWVQQNITFRFLRHWHMLLGLDFNETVLGEMYEDSAYVEFGVYYYVNNAWTKGWKCRINVTEQDQGPNWIVTELNVTWYRGNGASWERQYNEYVYAHWEGHQTRTVNAFKLWVDVWFNKENASSIGGGRLVTYYYPIFQPTATWLKWAGEDSPSVDWNYVDQTQYVADYFMPLVDYNGNLVTAPQIEMVKAFTRIEIDADQSYRVETREISELEWHLGTEKLEGVNTPIPIEPKQFETGQWGFFAPLYHAIMWIGNQFVQALTYAALTSWTYFVYFLDTIASWAGYPNLFTNFLAYVTSFYAWMVSSFSYLISLLTSGFTALAATMTYTLGLISLVATYWVMMFNTFVDFFNGVYTSGVNIWNDFGMYYWIMVACIMYPLYLIFLWDEKGGDAVISQLTFLMNVLSFIASMMISVVQIFISLIGTIIESIPVVE